MSIYVQNVSLECCELQTNQGDEYENMHYKQGPRWQFESMGALIQVLSLSYILFFKDI